MMRTGACQSTSTTFSARPAFWLLGVVGLCLSCTTDPVEADRDQDGVPNYNDCAPDDPAIFPGAPEICDNIDNNCNTRIDENITVLYYIDNDEDGFAGPANPVLTCSPPAGASLEPTDCNDTNDQVYPGAIERCDGLDNDCDNQVDPPFVSEDFRFVGTGEIELNGEAEYRDGEEDDRYLALTGFTAQERGAAWFQTSIPGESWEVRFQFEVTRDDGGEGLTFVFKPNQRYRTLGPTGPGMGIYGEDEDGWVVEFDTINNPQGDVDSDGEPHIALATIRDQTYLRENTSPPNFRGEGFNSAVVRMVDSTLTVRLNGELVINRTMEDYDPSLSYTMGFTASTSVPNQQGHHVDNVDIVCPAVATTGPGDSGLPK